MKKAWNCIKQNVEQFGKVNWINNKQTKTKYTHIQK